MTNCKRSSNSIEHIFLEAESFDDLGGWLIETNAMSSLGSAYICAHGMGKPVADAKTTFTVPKEGEWHVWAKTKDWSAIWNKSGVAPGIFNIKINNTVLMHTLGNCGEKWSWQKAGIIKLSEGKHRMRLQDLTGFNGRCDAIYLTLDAKETPENDNAFSILKSGIKTEDYAEEFDLIVVGGGMAGIGAAVTALLKNLKTLLIHERNVLGGCNSSEIRVPLGGGINTPPYENLGNIIGQVGTIFHDTEIRDASYSEDARKRHVFERFSPELCRVALNESVIQVERDKNNDNQIAAVIAKNTITGKELRYRGKLFADCTGNGQLALAMGAEAMYGREAKSEFSESLAPEKADKQVMGHSLMWLTETAKRTSHFPDIEWGLPIDEENVIYTTSGNWDWETGQYRNQFLEEEQIRDYCLMMIYSNWAYIKNHSARKKEFSRHKLSWVSAIGGKRESYRIKGDLVLTQNDIEDDKFYEDETAATTWSLDLHLPDPKYTGKFPETFRSCAFHRTLKKAYPIPYRCLYAKDVDNLFLGGRSISVSHVAFSSVRVMRTLGMLGEVVGLAAAICKKHGINPREVYSSHLNELKEGMREGVSLLPCWGWKSEGKVLEKFHFQELGYFYVSPSFDIDPNDKELIERIKALEIEFGGISDENKKLFD